MSVPALAGKPCPPWAYGALVAPGTHFIDSGFYGQNTQEVDGELRLVFGKVLVPSHATLCCWAEHVMDCLQNGTDPTGGWAPHRSCEVRWGRDGVPLYYKSADNQRFDLQYFPSLQTIDERESKRTMVQRCDEFFHILAGMKDERINLLPTEVKKLRTQRRFDSYVDVERMLLNSMLEELPAWYRPAWYRPLPLVILASPPGDDMLMRETTGGEGQLAKILALRRSRKTRSASSDKQPEDDLGEPLAKIARKE